MIKWSEMLKRQLQALFVCKTNIPTEVARSKARATQASRIRKKNISINLKSIEIISLFAGWFLG